MSQKYSGGEEGFIGIADESDPLGGTGTPGVFVTPTQFLMAESCGLDASPATIKRDVYGGGRDSDQGYRTGKQTVGGPLGLALYPHNGILALQKALGKKVSRTAIAADTTTAATTGQGTVSYTLTAGGSWKPGDIAFLGTTGTPTYEPLPVLSYNAGTKVIELPTPQFTHAAVGTSIARLAHDQYQPYTSTDNIGNSLGTVSVEENVGGKYSERYVNGIIGKWALKASSSKFDVTFDVNCSSPRALANGEGTNPSPTAFDENDPTWNDLGFEFTDGFLCFPVDPTDTGAATLQLVADGQDWELEVNNNVKAQPCNDRTVSLRQYPMKRTVGIKMKMLNGAARPVGWTDFLTRNLDVPWFAFAALNIGSPAVPVWVVIVFYAPTVRYTKATEVRGLDTIVGEQIEASARRANGLEKLYVSVYAP